MFKFLTQRVNLLVLSLALFLSVLLGLPNIAQADKAPKSVLFDPTGKLVNVAAIYETTPTAQKDVISSVMKSSKSFFKKAPGFSSFSLLKSEDGARVITLTQWQDAASYQAFLAQPAEESSKFKKEKTDEAAEPAVAPNRTVIFEIDKTQAPEGIIPGIHGKAALVQFSEITAKAPDDQSKLLTSAEDLLPEAAKMYPSPQSIVLLRSIDSSGVALLANWGYAADEFEDLSKAPTFKALPDDVASLANNDQHLYEVVKIVSAKSKSKDAKSESKDKD